MINLNSFRKESEYKMYDAIIIGAGPAGLFNGCVFEEHGIDYKIIEQGKKFDERDKQIEEDVSYGFGGAGLFSDGKLSYPPSASKLWTKLNPKYLKKSYEYVKKVLKKSGIEIKEWNPSWIQKVEFNHEKEYESQYLSEEERFNLLKYIETIINDRIIYGERVLKILRANDTYIVKCKNTELSCRSIIIATGKKSSLELFADDIKFDSDFCAEMGVRLETKIDNFIPYKKSQIDYKNIKKIDETTERRTFCCCKNGKVMRSVYGDKITYNGESTKEDSSYSNIGVVIRSTDKNSQYVKEMELCLNKYVDKEISVSEYGKTKNVFGEKMDSALKELIICLIDDVNDGKIYGPEIERYGYYPNLDSNLCARDQIYFIGDSTGAFRGIMAAMISATYVGMHISNKKQKFVYKKMQELNIKQSDTSEMELIFTAQSKAYFYCRDVVCQYVLQQGFLPLNPFRVFGYFLSDRVDRELIRRGNNQLIRECKELWVFGQIADGVLFEIASAIKQGKKVRFFSIGTRVEEIKEIDVEQISFEPEVHARKIKKNDLINFIKNESGVQDEMQISLFDYLNTLK